MQPNDGIEVKKAANIINNRGQLSIKIPKYIADVFELTDKDQLLFTVDENEQLAIQVLKNAAKKKNRSSKSISKTGRK
jgi:bifunctional DNA-binding transcriptional regulator/antitoxin component of YhaV-PrlF toxin-antitoxin module